MPMKLFNEIPRDRTHVISTEAAGRREISSVTVIPAFFFVIPAFFFVIPVKTGIQKWRRKSWIPDQVGNDKLAIGNDKRGRFAMTNAHDTPRAKQHQTKRSNPSI